MDGDSVTNQKVLFGEQRLVRPEVGAVQKALFRTIGLADPAHYLHSMYFQRALTQLRLDSPARILDAGCGRGDYSLYLAKRFPSAEIIGLDIDPQRIDRNLDTAKRLGLTNITFLVSDLTTLEHEAYFDFVLSVDVLEHLTEQKLVLRKLAQTLKPGGSAFYHIPTLRPKPVPFARFLKDFHAWADSEHVADDRSAEEFTRLVAESGLEVLTATPTFGYYTGELANSIFVLPYKNTAANRVLQAALTPLCRGLAMLDFLGLEKTRYAVAVAARRPK